MMPRGRPHPHLSPLSLVWPGAGQSRVLLAGQRDAEGDRLWHGEPRQHLGAERSCQGAAAPCLPPRKGHKMYLGHDGIGQTGAALGATGGRRQFLQEGEGRGCLCSLLAACTGMPGVPTLTGSWCPEAGVAWGCRSCVGWPSGTWVLRRGTWLPQELRGALQDGTAGMSPPGSGDLWGCLGSSEGAGQGMGSLQRASEPCLRSLPEANIHIPGRGRH